MARMPYPDRPADTLARLPVPLNAFRMMPHAPDLTGPAIDRVGRTLDPAELDALHGHFTVRETVEIIMVAGCYAMVAPGLMNGLDVDVDPSGDQFLGLANIRDDVPPGAPD